MRIAQIIPVLTTTPPNKYGGIERVVEELSLGLARKGHRVTIFAAKGSRFKQPNINLIQSAPFATFNHLSQNRYWEIHQFLSMLAKQQEFDMIHLHYEPFILNCTIDNNEFNLISFLNVPFVQTFHNTTHLSKHLSYYKSHQQLWDFNYVFISRNQRQPLNFFNNSRVIYNGIPVERFDFNNNPADYLLYLGRVMKDKGVLEAIQVARLANRKLIIAGKVDSVDKSFYEREVKHLIDGKQVIFVGELDFKQKVEYYKNALCLLFPIKWEEPFGLVMIEAMACGTPVVAFNRGSVPEVIKDGQTGFVVKTVSEMVKAVLQIDQIDRQRCREWVEQKFSVGKMVDAYEQVYFKVLAK